MGIAFVCISALISFYIDKVDRKRLLSMPCIITELHFFYVDFLSFFRQSFLVGGVCGIRFINISYPSILCDGCMFYDIFELWTVWWNHQCHIGCLISNKYQVRFKSFLPLLDDLLINAYEYIRAMATCLILMFGRLGAVSGSNFVGILLDTNCELIFYLYGALILSKL